MVLILTVVVSYFITKLFIPPVFLLLQYGVRRKNFLGQSIPSSAGLVLFLTSLAVLPIASWGARLDNRYVMGFFFAITALTLAGLLDDVIGTADVKGLKGHLGLLLSGKLTTGGLKAIVGLGTAIGLTIPLIMPWHSSLLFLMLFLILNVGILILSTNALNSLDLRPGRAIKGFILGFLLIVLVSGWKDEMLVLLPLLGGLIAYAPYDFRAEAMMGDTGSNLLGVALGFVAVTILPLSWKVVGFVLLLMFHIVTEKYSLTEIISRVKLLRFLDEFGRVTHPPKN